MSTTNLSLRHSFYDGDTPRDSLQSDASWKSDVNVSARVKPGYHTKHQVSQCSSNFRNSSSGDCYYKRYEHDEIPVKENSDITQVIRRDVETRNSDLVSLTNSDLEKLEKKIYKNISQELQTDDSSVSGLESNIKFFKTTVLEIFDNFYNSMKDFEIYKQRFEDILAKSRIDAVADMEDFIKDMINHIMSSDSNITHDNKKWVERSVTEIKEGDLKTHSNTTSVTEKQTAKLLESLHSVVEAYKNDNYLTDSTGEDTPSKLNTSTKTEEIFNIYLLSGTPCVQIKMNDRILMSEINIKDSIRNKGDNHGASADDLKKLADKKLELEEYVKQQPEAPQVPDREIPVKVSFAKKNIYLNEDFTYYDREKDVNKSFMSKICSYICKKLRKN